MEEIKQLKKDKGTQAGFIFVYLSVGGAVRDGASYAIL